MLYASRLLSLFQFDVKIKYGNRNNCVYHATGVDPGQFHCGDEYIVDCKKDFRYGQQITCGNPRPRYAAAWVCEF